ncbi:MAG: acyl-CoA dehydrogenase family protein, partial [Novosphingobium sp.]
MNFTLSDDHLALRDAARTFLSNEVKLEPYLRPETNEHPVERDGLWQGIQALGWAGAVVPEAYGGLGMTYIDLVMIVAEIGRTLAPSPFFGTLAGGWAIERCGTEEQKSALLSQIAAGELTVALAVADPNGDVNGMSGGATAKLADGQWTLNGKKSFVVEAGSADKIVVVADVDGQQGFFLVDAKSAGVEIERLDWRDVTREVNEISFNGVAAERLPASDADSWPWIRDRLYLVLAAESAGGAAQSLDDAVAYAKERIAFGRPIGSYQSIKHGLAEHAGGIELATAGVQFAAWALSENMPEARKAAAIAQSYASEQYSAVTFRNIQVFGAIGFTWEMRNHLYYKRARANAEMLGAPHEQREQLIQILEA